MAEIGLTPLIRGLDPQRPVLIAGPTASGKSALAARIVAEQGGVIVNADALQVYANWRILTARPSEGEEAALPHALYGHVARDQPYSTGHWLRDVAALNVARPVIVGGTGLYFMALTEGLADIPATPPDVRHMGDRLSLPELVAALDPRTAARIDLNNRARVQRAWEVLTATGRPLRDWQDDTPPPLFPRATVSAFVLRPDPDWLNARIDRRFDQMMEMGAMHEAKREAAHYDPALPSSRAIGAPELIAALRGEITVGEATERAKLASRQYAKRQRTWFRSRMKDWTEITLP